MQAFDDCVCIAQARVIAGRQKEPHVCTIAFHEPTSSFLRFCLPFAGRKLISIRRWHRFRFYGSKEDLEPRETRRETYHFGGANITGGAISQADKNKIHRLMLSTYKLERDLNIDRDSIGICVPHGPLVVTQVPLDPDNEKDRREFQFIENMKTHGRWYPNFRLVLSGKRMVDNNLRDFRKTLLAWDFFEAYRRGEVNPVDALATYKEPYIILGNTMSYKNAFMAIGILSAPPGAIQACAIHQQLGLL